MRDRFNLEDDIMNLYRITDDLNLYYEKYDQLSEDDRDNILLGIKTMAPLRIEKLYDCFREVLELDEYNPKVKKDKAV